MSAHREGERGEGGISTPSVPMHLGGTGEHCKPSPSPPPIVV